nr:dihydrolipoamide acetyltransferase family protein [Ktedonobacteraceae bacterium]
MAKDVILPALGMSQDTGKILQWLKAEGEQVVKGEPLLEIETDKATAEIAAPMDGVLAHVAASVGDDIPVGQVIAVILAPEEVPAHPTPSIASTPTPQMATNATAASTFSPASALASRIAAEHHLDLSLVKSSGRRIQKADVLTYLQNQEMAATTVTPPGRSLASPKARRLAREHGQDLAAIKGHGPGGAVLAADVLAALVPTSPTPEEVSNLTPLAAQTVAPSNGTNDLSVGNIWRIMAERTTQSWTNVPHFYLVREVNASRLIAWRTQMLQQSSANVTYTDLLVKIVATSLRAHPRLHASWHAGKITLNPAIHIGLAVAIEEGLVVPVIHHADTLSLAALAQQRVELVAKAQSGKLGPQDISEGTFTISNLGMYHVDAFNAIINQPQSAILAVGRITDRVVPLHGQPAIQPMMVLTLSCDHRVVDGARGAQFLDSVATLIQEPLGLLL